MPETPPVPRPPRAYRLIEVLVGMSIVVTLAGMLVPYSARVAERTALSKARGSLATIASSLALVRPGRPTWMCGSGQLPAGAPEPLPSGAGRLDRLTIPGELERPQRDALLRALQPDPWGSAYLVFLGGPAGGSRAVSAGPDRALDTPDDLSQPID